MFSTDSLQKIELMTAEEKLSLIREALYSDESLLKVTFRILLIADPGAADKIVAWFDGKVSH